ncbi:hypothetical protein BCL93_107195 [Onishia taeanensis]|uniref:Uncharacterized protein n=1 Tax=Onishia taeanensis TaxID=284577 RepID=A0A328XX95_9GAMM|nr:hypothetical protein BCL93_107195 [Halomonas taeanensis]
MGARLQSHFTQGLALMCIKAAMDASYHAKWVVVGNRCTGCFSSKEEAS